MGALTAKQLVNTELPVSTPTTVYTVPANTTTRVTEILLSNNSGAARVVNIWHVETGGTAGDDNEITGGGFSVPQGLPVPLAFNTFLEAGDFIRVDCDGADVALIISGIEEDVS